MKALVTGGAGFIGSHLADRLLREGYDVRILDNLEPRVHPKGKPAWIPKEAEFLHGDVREKEILAKALEGVRVVFHQAAYQDYMPDFSKFIHVNSVSTALIHEIILESRNGSGKRGEHAGDQVEKVIVASSQAVYGEGQYQCTNPGCRRYKELIQAETREQEQLQKGLWENLCPECGSEIPGVWN